MVKSIVVAIVCFNLNGAFPFFSPPFFCLCAHDLLAKQVCLKFMDEVTGVHCVKRRKRKILEAGDVIREKLASLVHGSF